MDHLPHNNYCVYTGNIKIELHIDEHNYTRIDNIRIIDTSKNKNIIDIIPFSPIEINSYFTDSLNDTAEKIYKIYTNTTIRKIKSYDDMTMEMRTSYEFMYDDAIYLCWAKLIDDVIDTIHSDDDYSD